jgi:GAF domain-containing protein
VGVLGDNPRWIEAFPGLARTGQDWKLRRLLEETETIHRTSAARLRALGRDDQARRAEQYAAWARLDLDEPQAARRLYSAARDLREVPGLGLLVSKILEGALRLAGADRGNVQILDPVTGSLRIAAQCGFGAEFLEYFAVVDGGGSACGRAARERVQTVIVDVGIDAGFAPHRDIAAAAAFRAVQSTPLIERSGHLLGVVSTHYPRPFSPLARDREIMKRYGELAGQFMASHLGTPAHGRQGVAGPRIHAAKLSGTISRNTAATGLSLQLGGLVHHHDHTSVVTLFVT